MNNPPLVSIVISAFNHENYINECLLSFSKQTYNNKELILLNDGSTDNTHQVICELLPKIKSNFKNVIYKNNKNQGVANSMNEALRLSKGAYITGTGSDDFFICNEAITKLIKVASQNQNVGLVFSNSIIVNSSGSRVYWDQKRNSEKESRQENFQTFIDYFLRKRKDIDLNNISYLNLLKGNFIPNVHMLNKQLVLDLGGYEEGLEDWSLWLKILKHHKIMYIDECLGAYRWHDNNLSHNFPVSLTKKTLFFLTSEKKYCFKNGLSKEWFEIYMKLVKRLLKQNSLDHKEIGLKYSLLARYKFLRKIYQTLL